MNTFYKLCFYDNYDFYTVVISKIDNVAHRIYRKY